MRDCKKEQVEPENNLPELLAAWRDDFRNVVSKFEIARARIKQFEEAELRQGKTRLELDQLESELATCKDKMKRLSLQTISMKSLEASGKLKDRKIRLLEQERLEATRFYSATIDELRSNLEKKTKRINQLETSIHRHEETLAKFQQHLATLRKMYAVSRSAENYDDEKTQVIEARNDVMSSSTQPDPSGFDEFQVESAEEFLKTQVINMREPLLKARRSAGK